MAMTLRSEGVGDAMPTLPSEVTTAITTAVKANPSADVFVIVREVLETRARAASALENYRS